MVYVLALLAGCAIVGDAVIVTPNQSVRRKHGKQNEVKNISASVAADGGSHLVVSELMLHMELLERPAFSSSDSHAASESTHQEVDSGHNHKVVMLTQEVFPEDQGANVLLGHHHGEASNVLAPHYQRQQGFVKIIARIDGEKTSTLDVEIATPFTIMCVFLVMYTPILLGWILYFHFGRQEKHYQLLLPLTLCTTLIGDNFVNKSLAVLMGAPMVITACQALSMGCFASLWTAVELNRTPLCWATVRGPLGTWSIVAVMFTLYQLMNHFVALYCSLAERTVFTNLCPVISLLFEVSMMPSNLKIEASFNMKCALFFLVAGAITFSLGYPDFTSLGVFFASMMVVAVVPYRLAQRYALNEARYLPVMLLVAYDGFFLATPSSSIAAVEQTHFMTTYDGWMSDSSVPIMMVLSMMTFTGNHICALLMLSMNSATALQVYQNLSNFVVVGLGIVVYGDNVLSSPLVLIGLITCLMSGLWYAVEAQPKAPSEAKQIPDVPLNAGEAQLDAIKN